MAEILVLGADGFVGEELVGECLRRGIAFGATSRRKNSPMHFLDFDSPDLGFVKSGDFSHAVICGARPLLTDCEDDPRGTYRTNVMGTKKLVSQLWALGIFPVFISTDHVFEGEEGVIYNESSDYSPITEYGRQKVELEEFLRNSECPNLIVRLSKTYSLMQDDDKMLAHLAKRLRTESFVEMATDQVFCPVWVGDVASGICSLIQNDCTGIFHIAATAWSRFEIATYMAERIGVPVSNVRKCSIWDVPDGVKRPKHLVIDSSLFLSASGVKPLELDEAINKFVGEEVLI